MPSMPCMPCYFMPSMPSPCPACPLSIHALLLLNLYPSMPSMPSPCPLSIHALYPSMPCMPSMPSPCPLSIHALHALYPSMPCMPARPPALLKDTLRRYMPSHTHTLEPTLRSRHSDRASQAARLACPQLLIGLCLEPVLSHHDLLRLALRAAKQGAHAHGNQQKRARIRSSPPLHAHSTYAHPHLHVSTHLHVHTHTFACQHTFACPHTRPHICTCACSAGPPVQHTPQTCARTLSCRRCCLFSVSSWDTRVRAASAARFSAAASCACCLALRSFMAVRSARRRRSASCTVPVSFAHSQALVCARVCTCVCVCVCMCVCERAYMCVRVCVPQPWLSRHVLSLCEERAHVCRCAHTLSAGMPSRRHGAHTALHGRSHTNTHTHDRACTKRVPGP